MAANELKYSATLSAAQFVQAYREIEAGATKVAEDINRKLGGSVEKTLNVRFKVDDRTGARQIAAVEKERLTALDAIINKQRQLNKTERGSVTSLRQQINEAKQIRDGIAKTIDTSTVLGSRVKTINPLWEQQAAKVAQLQRQLDLAGASGFWQKAKVGLNVQGLINFSNGLVQVTQGFQAASIVAGQFTGAINSVIQTAANLQQFALAFQAIGAGASGATQALAEVQRISLGLGVNINTVQDSFQQLTPVILNSGGSISDVSNIVEALSSRFAAFGLSGDKARRVTNGIIQAFAKGKLQAEEFTQQIAEADPAFGTDFAKSVGVSVSELQKLIKAGEITTDVLIDKLPGVSKSTIVFGKLGDSAREAAQALASGNVTIEQVRQQFGSLNELSLRKLGESAKPAIDAFFNLQAVFIDFFRSASQTGALDGISQAIGTIVNAIANLAKVLLSGVEVVGRVVSAFNPLISLLAGIPGLVEAAAVLFTGRLLAGIKATNSIVEGAGGAWKRFSDTISNSVSNAAKSFQPFRTAARLEGAQAQAALLQGQYTKLKRELDSVSSASSRVGQRLAELQARRDQLQGQIAARRVSTGVVDPGALRQVEELDRRINSLSTTYGTLESRQGRLRASSDEALGALQRQQQVVKSTEGSLATLQANTSATGRAFAGLSRGISAGVAGIGGALKGVASAAGAAIGGLLSALGPIGVALLAISVAQAAYTDATAGARAETDRQATALKALVERNNELAEAIKRVSQSGQQPEEPSLRIDRLGFVAASWSKLGLAISDAWSVITGSSRSGTQETSLQLDQLVSKIQQSKASIDALQGRGTLGGLLQGAGFRTGTGLETALADAFALVERFTFDKGTKQLAEDVESAQVALAKLGDSGLVAANGLRKQVQEVANSIPKLRQLKKESQTSTEAQGLLSKGFSSGLETLRDIEDERGKLLDLIKDFEKLDAAKVLDERGQQQLKLLREQYNSLGTDLSSAKTNLQQFGVQSGAAADAVERSAKSVDSLKESLKGLQDQLDTAIPGTDEFAVAAARLAATEFRIGAAKTAADDPFTIQAGSVKAFLEISRQVAAEQKRLADLQVEPFTNADEIDASSKKVAQLKAELEAIAQNEYVATVQIQAERTRLETELRAVDFQIKFEPGALRDAVQLIGKVQSDIAAAQVEFAKAQAVAQSGAYSPAVAAEKLAQASTQFEIKAKSGAAAIIDSARSLVDNLQQAQGRLSNLVLGKPEFFSAEEVRAEIQRINADFEKEVEKAGFRPQIKYGTSVEQALEKQSFIEARREAEGLRSSIDSIINAVRVLVTALAQVNGINLNQIQGFDKIREAAATARTIPSAFQRVGEVFGTISANGQETVLYYDKLLRSTQSISREAFDRLQAEDAAAKKLNEQTQALEQQRQAQAGAQPSQDAASAGANIASALQKASSAAQALNTNTAALPGSMQQGATLAASLSDGLANAATQAQNISDVLTSLNGLTVSVNIRGIPGRWAGGPTTAGELYQVNELGKEGFLSPSGRLTPINKPRNALWRAPSSGTVIPAHVMDQLTVPTGGVKVNNRNLPSPAGHGGMQRLARALQAGLRVQVSQPRGLEEMAAVQAHQAQQIGKLSRAVTDLAHKDWNVNVGLKTRDDAVYLQTLNSRLG